MRAFIHHTVRASLLSLLLVATTGCITNSLLKSMIRQNLSQNGTFPNWIGIHKNPKVGDFAEHQALDGSVIRYEILSQKGPYYEISQRHVNASGSASVLLELSFNLIVDKNGNAQEGYVVDLTSGERDRIRIAGPGENGYVSNVEVVTNRRLLPESVVTPAGEFAISEFRVYEYYLYQNGVLVKGTQTQLIHPDVKFQIVRLRAGASTEFPAVTVVRTIASFAPGDPVQKRVIDFLLGKLEKQEYTNGSDLIRQN